jgi:hypothetical protein
MKKVLGLFIFCSFFAFTNISAQFTIGLKAGMNGSTVRMSNEPENPDGMEGFNDLTDPLIGWQAGIHYGYRINNLEINWDMLFAQKGYKYQFDNPFTSATEDSEVRYHYLSFPASTRYYIVGGLYAGLGIETSILLSAIAEDQDGETIDLIELGDRGGIRYNRIDLGPLVEVGIKIKERLGIQLRYIHGINNIFGEEVFFTDINGQPLGTQDVRLRNRSVQLSITADLVVIE